MCIIQTPGREAPYIDEISPGLYLAAGGCGYAAKSCDEIGRIAAQLVLRDEWTTELPQGLFKIQWRSRKVDD